MVATWVKEFTEESFGGSPFEVGQTVLHPDGRNVRIISGLQAHLERANNTNRRLLDALRKVLFDDKA